jgi:uncharacterized surface protein with fasciclin (FAS1) repeats
MKTTIALGALCALLCSTAFAQNTVIVGGELMYPNRDIVANAVNSKDHTTLVAAVQAGGLVEVLQSEGPFTVFAPTNAAFAKLPQGTVATLLQPENKEALVGVLTYHVVPGKIDSKTLAKMIKDNGGSLEITTVNGQKLTAMFNGPSNVVLKDTQGTVANITTYDVMQSNGVIHVIDTVVLPQ